VVLVQIKAPGQHWLGVPLLMAFNGLWCTLTIDDAPSDIDDGHQKLSMYVGALVVSTAYCTQQPHWWGSIWWASLLQHVEDYAQRPCKQHLRLEAWSFCKHQVEELHYGSLQPVQLHLHCGWLNSWRVKSFIHRSSPDPTDQTQQGSASIASLASPL